MPPAMRSSMRVSTLDLRPMEARMRSELTIGHTRLVCNYLQALSRTDDPFHAIVECPGWVGWFVVRNDRGMLGGAVSGPRWAFRRPRTEAAPSTARDCRVWARRKRTFLLLCGWLRIRTRIHGCGALESVG